jgi:hypothetical protein
MLTLVSDLVPAAILVWYRKLVARKFDGSKARRGPGRPRIGREVELLIVRMAKADFASDAGTLCPGEPFGVVDAQLQYGDAIDERGAHRADQSAVL